MSFVYDAGVFVAADRDDRLAWAAHRARVELGLVPVTTSPVVAQVSRSGRQAQLRRFLRGCEIEPFAAGEGHAVGALLGAAGTSDVVDAHVVTVAARTDAIILTSDVDDLSQLSNQLPSPVRVRRT